MTQSTQGALREQLKSTQSAREQSDFVIPSEPKILCLVSCHTTELFMIIKRKWELPSFTSFKTIIVAFFLPDRLPPDVLLAAMRAVVRDHDLVYRDFLRGGHILQRGLINVFEQRPHLLEPVNTSKRKIKI